MAKWAVTVRVSGALRPVKSEVWPSQESADKRAEELREQIRRSGWTHRVSVAEVVEEQK